MDARDQGIAEIKERLKLRKDSLGLKYYKETPSGEIDPAKVPAVLVMEGTDLVVKRSSRNTSGYPARRALELTLECIVNSKTHNARTLCKDVRRAVFLARTTEVEPDTVDVQIADGVFINENRTEGPFGYGLPNIIGMRLVIDLIYNDNGI